MRLVAPDGPAPSESALGRPRLHVLDGLRFVAALMVLGYHYLTLRDGWGNDPQAFSPELYHVAQFGWLGVEVFFLISGFVICMSVWGRTLGDFVKSRVSRLYPAYWVAVLLTASVLTLWPRVRSADSLETVLTNLTMLQQGVGVSDLDDVYWSLFIELKFYLLFALVVYKGVTYRRCVLFCGLWTVAGVVAYKADTSFLSVWAIAPYSPYFIAGIAFYLMHRFRPTMLLWAIVAVEFLLAQHYVKGRVVMNLGDKAATAHDWPARIGVLLAFLLMAAIALGVFDGVWWRWLSRAGSLTYPLYLLHMYIGFTLIALLRHRLPAPVLLMSIIALMLVLSYAVNRWVERPVGAWLRDGIDKGLQEMRRGSRAAPPAERPGAWRAGRQGVARSEEGEGKQNLARAEQVDRTEKESDRVGTLS
ncbi:MULTISPECIES: acyltransferase family protein [Streptomyces]|uniref:Acyltransferase n=1 Tax=Streptomyces siderophoricus TaxID=2802281 RepID=A0ABS1MJN0_9ACTN|nr:acyltransferase [Streptomyces sp. 9-7]MBL1088238.1 acyltransferase [Streptomyces sp. 9-7]